MDGDGRSWLPVFGDMCVFRVVSHHKSIVCVWFKFESSHPYSEDLLFFPVYTANE